MGKASQNEKRSFLKTRLGGFAARLWKGPQKSNDAMPPIAEARESVIQSVVAAPSAYHEQKSKESEGFGRDRLARVPEKHAKQEKAIGHIEKLLKQISQLQNEIENGLKKAEICIEQKISNLMAPSKGSPCQTPQRKQVKEPRKQEADKSPVAKRPVLKHRERLQKNTKKDNNHQANNEKLRKLCRQCKEKKSKSDFHKDRSCKDGLARWCKECKAKAARKYRKKKVVS